MQLELPLKNISSTSLITAPISTLTSRKQKLHDLIDTSENLDKIEYLIRQDELDIQETLDKINVPSTKNTVDFLRNNVLSNFSIDDAKIILICIQNRILFDYSRILNSAGGATINLTECFSTNTPRSVIHELFNFIADDHSFTAVGRGEFFFNLLMPDTYINRESGGDLMYRDKRVEIKGKHSRLASQKTHASPMTVGKTLQKLIGDNELKAITEKSLTHYYPKIFSNKQKFVDFLFVAFSNLMCHNENESFDYISSCIETDRSVNFQRLKINQMFVEYAYYIEQEQVDWIFFIDPNTLKMIPVRNRTDLEKAICTNLKTTMNYSFNGEHGKALRWRVV